MPVLPTVGPHFFADAPVDGTARLAPEEHHHLTRVLRSRPGDPVSLADGRGGVHQAVLGPGAELRVARSWTFPPPDPPVVVYQALPKGRKLDQVVQQLSEIGVDRFVPVTSARSEARYDEAKAAKVVARLRGIAHAAAKQARRVRILSVAEIAAWPTNLREGAVMWEEASLPLSDVPPFATLLIGPEGGLSAEEVAATGLPALRLGDAVLRTETAPVVAAALALHRLGRLG